MLWADTFNDGVDEFLTFDDWCASLRLHTLHLPRLPSPPLPFSSASACDCDDCLSFRSPYPPAWYDLSSTPLPRSALIDEDDSFGCSPYHPSYVPFGELTDDAFDFPAHVAREIDSFLSDDSVQLPAISSVLSEPGAELQSRGRWFPYIPDVGDVADVYIPFTDYFEYEGWRDELCSLAVFQTGHLFSSRPRYLDFCNDNCNFRDDNGCYATDRSGYLYCFYHACPAPYCPMREIQFRSVIPPPLPNPFFFQTRSF